MIWTRTMITVLALLLLLLSGGAWSERNCSYQDVLNYLNLTKKSSLFYMNRPVTNYKTPTEVNLDLLLYAILEVKEKEQKFVPYVWITMWWHNDYISWNPDDFCGISYFSIPNEFMWKPDITIVEVTEQDKAPPSPYVTITHNGNVEQVNDQVLTSTCRMQVHKFPFDTQSCNLSFKSFTHADDEIQLVRFLNSSQITEDSQEVMRIQSEWFFLNITVTSETNSFYGFNQTTLIYTINMRRRSALYIVNFILPILFLLCLDLASFLVSDSGGEKLGFKVTVLLAVTVMQLILNEILPASSDRIPLIAVYCIGVFSLMMISLMETVLVMHLIEKDSEAQDEEETEEAGCLREDKPELKNLYHYGRKRFSCHTAAELLSVSKEKSCNRLIKESNISAELVDEIKTLTQLLRTTQEDGKPGYWRRMTRRINRVFMVLYLVAASVFLSYMILMWDMIS